MLTAYDYPTAEFAEAAVEMEPFIEGQLGISVRKDVRKKPIQFLGTLLSFIGLPRIDSRQTTVGDSGKIRYYFVPPNEKKRLEEIFKRRAEIKGWSFVREHYGFEDTLEDMEYLAGWAA